MSSSNLHNNCCTTRPDLLRYCKRSKYYLHSTALLESYHQRAMYEPDYEPKHLHKPTRCHLYGNVDPWSYSHEDKSIRERNRSRSRSHCSWYHPSPALSTTKLTVPGTTAHCGKYYKVQTGDDCQVVALNNTIVISLFQQINPDINADCTNLVPGLYYCVEPTADWNNANSSSSTTSSLVTAPAPTPSGRISHILFC